MKLDDEELAAKIGYGLCPHPVSQCPEDKGLDFRPDGPYFGPTAHYAFGLSYRLNQGPWENTKYEVAGALPGQKSGWVKQPSEYIYVYEPPALPMHKPLLNPDLCHMKGIREPYNYFHWHLNTGRPSVFDIANDGQKAISPILFVDGQQPNTTSPNHFTRTGDIRRKPRRTGSGTSQ